MSKDSITYAEWKAERNKGMQNDPELSRVFEALLTRTEWDERWWTIHNRYAQDGRTRDKAFQYARETMERKHGPRPDGPPTAKGLALRILWLTKVKGMDWKKLLIGGVAAALGAAAAAIPAAAEGGITTNEWYGIGAVALGALALYLKEPNKKGFASPTKKQ